MKWAKFGRISIDKATGQTDQYRRITASPPAEPPRCKQRRQRGEKEEDGPRREKRKRREKREKEGKREKRKKGKRKRGGENVQPRLNLSIDGERDRQRDKGREYKDRHAKANGTEDTKG